MTPARIRVTDQPGTEASFTFSGNMAVILLDGNSQVIAENNRARQMLHSEETLRRAKGGGIAATGEYGAAFAERVERALRQPGFTREAMVMHVPGHRLPVAITVQAFRYGGAAAAIMVSDPNRAPAPDEELLRTLYGLTGTEIRVGCALAGCHSVSETARLQNMTPHTVRTHLKSLFQKTRCHRQSELLAVLLHTPTVPEILF